MDKRPRPRIAVIGAWNWVDVAADLFRRVGLSAAPIRSGPKCLPFRIIPSRVFRGAECAHVVWGGAVPLSLVANGLLGKKLVWHWIGTDVLWFAQRRGRMHGVRAWMARNRVAAHLADSPELAAELAAVGIAAEVCRLLPASIQAEVLPLPDRFRVLSYWWDDKCSYYGGDCLLEVARRMPEVEFLVAGAKGRGAPKLPNVRFLGRLDSLDAVYADVSAFVRMPIHDSLSAMILESLARGRYVVCNQALPACRRATTPEELRAALEEIRRMTAPDYQGARYVRAHFSLEREADVLRRVYGRILE